MGMLDPKHVSSEFISLHENPGYHAAMFHKQMPATLECDETNPHFDAAGKDTKNVAIYDEKKVITFEEGPQIIFIPLYCEMNSERFYKFQTFTLWNLEEAFAPFLPRKLAFLDDLKTGFDQTSLELAIDMAKQVHRRYSLTID